MENWILMCSVRLCTFNEYAIHPHQIIVFLLHLIFWLNQHLFAWQMYADVIQWFFSLCMLLRITQATVKGRWGTHLKEYSHDIFKWLDKATDFFLPDADILHTCMFLGRKKHTMAMNNKTLLTLASNIFNLNSCILFVIVVCV